MLKRFIATSLLTGIAASLVAQVAPAPDLAELDVEQLTGVRVTSVSRHSEPLSGAAAAIYVVTQDDIRRQGFTTIADSLRYVPGLQVGQIDSHTWAVTARGFNNQYANKLLVQMDGRTVYTPLFAGVYWDIQDTILEDLDQIEVIRGPGASLWGANAVNGVINISSKSAADTQGWLVTSGGGLEEHGFGGIRYGGKLAEECYYRIYGSYKNQDASKYPSGADGDDDWQIGRAGFRLDWGSNDADLFTLQSDIYAGQESWVFSQASAAPAGVETLANNLDLSGANILGRWTKKLSDGSELKIQSYFDHSERESNLPKEQRNVFDLDAQHHFALNDRNDVVWGLGYRYTYDKIRNSYASLFTPSTAHSSLFNLFAQNETQLIQDCLRLTLGTKLEHNEFTGLEWQPSGRLAWTPKEDSTVWASVSRAVRTPARAEEDIRINTFNLAPMNTAVIFGNHNGDSEKLVAYELGFRSLVTHRFSYDIVAFYHDYDDLRSLEAGPPATTPPIPTVGTFYSLNKIKGEAWGCELMSDWKMLDWWRWRGSYTFFELNLRSTAGGFDPQTIALLEGNAPRNQFSLRSQMDLPHRVEFDLGVRYVDNLDNPHIPSYTAVDARLSWRPKTNLEISLVGMNLLQARHAEFTATQVMTPQREIERSVYGKITWRF